MKNIICFVLLFSLTSFLTGCSSQTKTYIHRSESINPEVHGSSGVYVPMPDIPVNPESIPQPKPLPSAKTKMSKDFKI